MQQGNKLKGALAKAPREKAMERLSPGVYRGERGGLVTQGGRQIQRQPQPQGNPWAQAGDPQANLLQGAQMPMDQGNYMMTPEIAQRLGMQAGAMPGMPQDKMYRFPQMPQMPQPSANNGGQYRLSPGVYGTRDQAMQQYNQQMQDMGMSRPIYQVPQGQTLDFVKPEQIIPYLRRG